MRGLEIGAGGFAGYPDYDQVDNDPQFEPTILCDASRLDPIPDLSYDHVYASNVLEHFSWRTTDDVLREWFRVVAHDGVLEVVVPDTLGIIEDYRDGKDLWPVTAERLAGSQTYPGNYHYAFFTRLTFAEHIRLLEGVQRHRLEVSHSGGGLRANIWKA